MDRSLRPPGVIYSSDRSGCSLFGFLGAMTSALFLEVWGGMRSGWWVSLLLATLGVAMLFRRRAVVIDPERGEVTLISREYLPVTTRRTVPTERLSVRLELPPPGSEGVAETVRLDESAGGPAFRIDLNSAEDARKAAERMAAASRRPRRLIGSSAAPLSSLRRSARPDGVRAGDSRGSRAAPERPGRPHLKMNTFPPERAHR